MKPRVFFPMVRRRRLILGLSVAAGVYCLAINALQIYSVWQPRMGLPDSDYSEFPAIRKQNIAACLREQNAASTHFAFAAFLSSPSTQYVQGAIVLARSIRRVTNLDLILMVLDEANGLMSLNIQSALKNEGWMLCSVAAIDGPAASASNRYSSSKMYSKIAAWKLIEYKALMMLDLDMLVMSNPTDIFTEILPKMLAENRTFGASVDHPEPGGPCIPFWTDQPAFNAGSVLLIPSMDHFEFLLKGIHTTPHELAFAEQSYLNALYGSNFYDLPFSYNGNIVSFECEPHLWNRGIKILHFTIQKPWVDNWFNIFEHLSCRRRGVQPYCALWQSILFAAPRPVRALS